MKMTTEPKEIHFIYCGLRKSRTKGFVIEIQLLNDDGSFANIFCIRHLKKYESIIGGVYTNVIYDGNSLTNYQNRKFFGKHKYNDDIVKWQAQEREARFNVSLEKMESDCKKEDFLRKQLAPLRAIYQSLNIMTERAALRDLIFEELARPEKRK